LVVHSCQAFRLNTISELLFFAFFTEAPILVPEDTTRAMLCERGYTSMPGWRGRTAMSLFLRSGRPICVAGQAIVAAVGQSLREC